MNQTLRILFSQIGQEAFKMLGAKNITYDNEALALKFQIMKNDSKITHIRVLYDYSSDTYTMQFFKKIEMVEEIKDVYFNELNLQIERTTGLSTRLPRFGKP